MEKRTIILVSLCLLLVCGCALADAGAFCDAIPQGVQELNKQDHPDEDIADCILLTDTPIGDICYLMTS